MHIIGDRVLVSRIEEEKKEGFETVEVQDSFVYRGKVERVGVRLGESSSTYHGASTGSTIVSASADQKIVKVKEGDTILFAKYSPDTHEIEHGGRKLKIVNITDILAIL